MIGRWNSILEKAGKGKICENWSRSKDAVTYLAPASAFFIIGMYFS